MHLLIRNANQTVRPREYNYKSRGCSGTTLEALSRGVTYQKPLALIKLEGPAIVSEIDRDLPKTLGIPLTRLLCYAA